MKRSLQAFSALLALTLIPSVALAHGGTYRGPGDTVPPGGGSGGPTSGPGPAAPGPSTPGPSGPSGPTNPGPSTGAPTGGGAPTGPKTGGGGFVGPDLSLWTFWWEFNKDPYLNLKAAVHSGGVVTGSADDFMGREKGGKDSLKPTEAQVRGKVVPALRKALEEETNNDIVTGCMIALGKIGGDPVFVEDISKKLPDQNQEISETAALALGILSYPSSLEPLTQLLKDTPAGRKMTGRSQEVHFRTRSFAAYGLGLIGYSTQDDKVKDQVISTLREVMNADKSSSKDIKVACILALGLVKDPDRKAIEDLRRILADSKQNEFYRAHIPTSLAKLVMNLEKNAPQRTQVIQDLLKVLNDRKDKEFVRQSATYAMGLLVRPGDENYEEVVKQIEVIAKESNSEQEKNFAMIALGKIGGAEAQNFLIGQLSKGKITVKPWAALGLGILGRNVADAGNIPDRIIADKLHELLAAGGNPSNLGAYAISLGILRDSTAKDLLLESMKKTSEDEFKGYCCVALGMIGAREVVSEIQEVVKKATRKEDLLKQAAIGLGLLGDKKLVTDLVDMLKEKKPLGVFAAVASALGFIGDQRSIDPLIATLQNKQAQPVGRGFSAVALGLICDKELLPWNSKIAVDLNYRASVSTLTDKSGGTGIVDIL